jgi:Trypsin
MAEMAEQGADQKPPGSDPVAQTLEWARLRFERQKLALEIRAKRRELVEQRDKSAWKALLANPLSVAVVGGVLTLMTSIVTSFLTARANLEGEQERAVLTRQSAQQALQADLIKKFVDGPPESVRGNLRFLADTGLIPDYAASIQKYLIANPTAAPQLGGHPTVLGGIQASVVDWPWLVSVYKSGAFTCNGTLIASRMVLAAANCLSEGTPTEVATVTDGGASVQVSKRVPIVKTFTHPAYSEDTMENDIALLELGQDLPPPFAAISAGGAADPGPGALALVTTLNFQSEPGSLLQSVTKIADNQQCAQLYDGRSVSNGIICAGFEHGHGGACPRTGSAGAPLVVIVKQVRSIRLASSALLRIVERRELFSRDIREPRHSETGSRPSFQT